ncbi:MAG: hypothetical protein ACHQQQ_09840 [Bacteroidota bacterium]
MMSCNKSNPADNGNPAGGSASMPSSSYGSFPVPPIENIGGVFGVVDAPFNIGPLVSETKAAFGGFQNSSASPAVVLVYGGDVKVNAVSMDTLNRSIGVIYALPKTLGGVNQPSVTFDSVSWAVFNIAGGVAGVVAFKDSVTAPKVSNVTLPAAGATLNHANPDTVKWDTPSSSDSIMVIATDANGHQVFKNSVVATAPYVILTPTDLTTFSGNGLVIVMKYRYVVNLHGTKNYAFVAETVNLVNVVWN